MITVHQIVLRGGLFCFGLDTPGPQFREISRERGRRSPAGRSQRLRPPWGPHTFARRSVKAGRGCSPSEAGLRAATHPPERAAVAHGAAFGRSARANCGRTPGKSRVAGAKAGGCAEKRRTAGTFRAASGVRHRAETGKTGRCRGCFRGFWRGFRGAQRGQRGKKGGISGLKAAKRAGKALHTAGFGRKTGRGMAFFRRRVTGSRSLHGC